MSQNNSLPEKRKGKEVLYSEQDSITIHVIDNVIDKEKNSHYLGQVNPNPKTKWKNSKWKNNKQAEFIANEIKEKSIFSLIANTQHMLETQYEEAKTLAEEHLQYTKIQQNLLVLENLLQKSNEIMNLYGNIMGKYNLSYFHSYIPQTEEDVNTANQLIFIKNEVVKILASAEKLDLSVNCFYGFYDISEVRKQIVNTAVSLTGKIPYEWDSKPQNAGWNERWNQNGAGLDCSGFIEWVYWTATGKRSPSLHSTMSIVETQQKITYGELKPGDLGTILDEGTYYIDYKGDKFYIKEDAVLSNTSAGYSEDEIMIYSNHVGIYVGKDIDGKDIWCHCQGGDVKTVTVGEFEKFSHFYRVLDVENK